MKHCIALHCDSQARYGAVPGGSSGNTCGKNPRPLLDTSIHEPLGIEYRTAQRLSASQATCSHQGCIATIALHVAVHFGSDVLCHAVLAFAQQGATALCNGTVADVILVVQESSVLALLN